MTEHVLKTWPDSFYAVEEGLKHFEWRRNDRNYAVGDTLVLRLYDPSFHHYNGRPPAVDYGTSSGDYIIAEDGSYRDIRVRVTYILTSDWHGVPEGYCVMSIVREESFICQAGFRTEKCLSEKRDQT